ncbi:TetR/AcrR family transcriptional regulator [Micromonospora craterilacus]|uniref:TetR/AcrR family transcriptional regulator n=1 Tax=Micromonospora craterilacus TaxID=1655439 RepID=A0A2W2EX55_9ACTN|nr:TetR/AcrR family transcriptional regulator [Micromonospora craterilacus]PZG21439.1 TetR/AcrR family transcriptional regulator [Micromonospora craterilacus]
MREWVPVPGSAKARLIEAAIHQFELTGYEAVNVVDLASKASVTTGALYHHFGSKLGLYLTVREDMEKRIVERMEGAAAAVGSNGHPAVRAALLVAFDAAVRFTVCRILGEQSPVEREDPVAAALRPLLTEQPAPAADILAAAWRAALLAVATGASSAAARASLGYVLDPR